MMSWVVTLHQILNPTPILHQRNFVRFVAVTLVLGSTAHNIALRLKYQRLKSLKSLETTNPPRTVQLFVQFVGRMLLSASMDHNTALPPTRRHRKNRSAILPHLHYAQFVAETLALGSTASSIVVCRLLLLIPVLLAIPATKDRRINGAKIKPKSQ
jgi:hypothetical protein